MKKLTLAQMIALLEAATFRLEVGPAIKNPQYEDSLKSAQHKLSEGLAQMGHQS